MNNMGDNSRSGWLRDNARVMTAAATAALAIIGLVGLIFILSELKELRRQNSYIESNLYQTYRPLGVAHTDPENPEGIMIESLYSKESLGKFSMHIRYHFYNYGQGVLSYIGYFALLTTEETGFRSRFLAGEFDTLTVDQSYSFLRRTTILPYDRLNVSKVKTGLLFQDIRLAEQCFVYVLFLYEDQAGNLYDTEHLDVLWFQESQIRGDFVVAELDTIRGYNRKETYHRYTPNERRSLIKAIRALDEPKDHPMAKVLEASR